MHADKAERQNGNTVPLIRWAGSKRKLIDVLAAESPSHFGTYYEPFLGSACLFYRLQPSHAVLGDLNPTLINFYRETRRRPEKILNSAVHLRRGRTHYYVIRERFHRETDKVKRAAMFLYLNRFCFNAIYRTNNRGDFNVPYGTETGSFLPRKQFVESSSLLKRTRLVCDDFSRTLKTVQKGDFVYLDPPYAYSQHRDRGEYGRGSFKIPDLLRLQLLVQSLHAKGAKFLLSYVECSEIMKIAKSFHTRLIPVKRCVASLASSRCIVNELVIKNF